MARDLIYYYDKDTFVKNEFGEIQTDFNHNFVIDGSKDSAKVIVLSFLSSEIKPFTIIKHENTNTWWIVSHDKVDRYLNENGTYLYKHQINLLGAKELLNARDLVGTGFYQNRYTIEEVIQRLFNHSTFELPIMISATNNLELDNKVDYLKTYSNYTLLSALNDFLDGYNCDFKLNFVEDSTHITQAIVYIISKTGDLRETPIDITFFNDVRENKTMDKNSHGQNVVSNAENVVSTVVKTFPTMGGVRLSSNSYDIKGDNALLRLPSNAFRVNWVDMVDSQVKITAFYDIGYGSEQYTAEVFSPQDIHTQESAIDSILDAIGGNMTADGLTAEEAEQELDVIREDFNLEALSKLGRYRFNLIKGYDPVKKVIYANEEILQRWGGNLDPHYYPAGLCDKDLWDTITDNIGCIYFTRNSRILNNFKFFNENGQFSFKMPNYAGLIIEHTYYSPFYQENHKVSIFIGNEVPSRNAGFNERIDVTIFNVSWVINYVPMDDFKIKIDNELKGKDMQLYNQNGKQTDSNALSKLLLSYAKEITGDNITRYKNFYVPTNIPKVGTLVNSSTDTYVINNVSLTYHPNEVGYFIEGEFTLSKSIATKSLMVNANRNIRDYGIPQDNNVPRQQIYKDIYSLSYTATVNSGEKLPLSKILNVGFEPSTYQEHIAVMKLTYNQTFGGEDDNSQSVASNIWYYQLNTTTYALKKSIYEILDFKDNNIIGYGSQNVWCGFNIKRVFRNQTDIINTPISYVDEKGEVKDFEIYFCTADQVMGVYDEYEELEKLATGLSYNGVLYNNNPFIDSLIYEGGHVYDDNHQEVGMMYGVKSSPNHDFKITEIDYNKDALEVPVFEYSAQLMDSKDVIIGQNILNANPDAEFNIYLASNVDKGTTTENNFHVTGALYFQAPNDPSSLYNATGYAVKMEYQAQKIVLSFYREVSIVNGEATFSSPMTIDELDLENKDLAIVRCRKNTNSPLIYSPIDPTESIGIATENDLMFILLNAENSVVGNTIELKINYKGS